MRQIGHKRHCIPNRGGAATGNCLPARCKQWPSLERQGAALCLCVYIQPVPHAHCKDSLLASCAPTPCSAAVCSAPYWTNTHKICCHFSPLKPPGCPRQHTAKGAWLWCHHAVINSSILQSCSAGTSLPTCSGYQIHLPAWCFS